MVYIDKYGRIIYEKNNKYNIMDNYTTDNKNLELLLAFLDIKIKMYIPL